MGAAEDYAAAAKAFREKNWQNGGTTVTPTTESQNLAAVLNQPGNTQTNNPTPYLQGVLAQAQKDTEAQKAAAGVTTTPESNPVSNSSSGGSNSNSNADYINSIYQANLASQKQAIEKQRQIQLQGLNGQETSANQNALQNLNNNDSLANQNLKQLQEVMANNGVRGGDNITATIGNQTAQQNGANSINQTKANQLQNINEQRSLINNNASADDLALLQKLQAARDGQMIDNNNTQQQYGLNLAQLMGKTADGQNTLGGNQLALQQQGQNFNQGLQTQQFNQGVKNDTFNQGMANKQFDYQKVQDDIKNGQWSTQTDNQMKQWAEGNKLNWAQFDQSTKQALAQIAISQQNANTNQTQMENNNANQQTDNTLQQNKFDWDKNPLNPANVGKAQSGSFNLDDYKGYVNQNLYKDVPTNPSNPFDKTTTKQLDVPSTERYILSQPITNDQKAQLYKLFNIPMK